MVTLHIEHPIPDFASWKQAFDSDPAGRERSGVKRYRISRPVDETTYVMIDLEFDRLSEAEALLTTMRGVWPGSGSNVSRDQQARILEIVETREY